MGLDFDKLSPEMQKQVAEAMGARTTKEIRVGAASKVLSVLTESSLPLDEQVKVLEQVVRWLRRVR